MLSRLYAVSSGLFVLLSRVVSTASDSHLSLHCQTTCRAALYAGNLFHYFLPSANLFFFFNIFFSKIEFTNTIRVPNILDPAQARNFVRLD